MDGIILLDKPIGKTSREMCNEIGIIFHTKKVGHVGTLDPFASGLLIIAFNKATKAVTFFDESIKEYEAEIVLGKETDTLDNTGKLIKEEKVREYSLEEINNTLNSFLGEIEQVPPLTSAIHVKGKRLYEYAHKGETVEIPSRKVFIHEIKLLSCEGNILKIYAKVSKGTYIRTLGNDIAKKLGTVGYLSSLKRVGVSPFTIKETASFDEIKEGKAKIYSMYEILSRIMKVVSFDNQKNEDIKNGKITYLDLISEEDRILVVDHFSNPVAVYTKDEQGRFKFTRGMF